MFAFQNMSNKRRRDDDESDSDDGAEYQHQQLKKSKTWFNDTTRHGLSQNPSPSYLPLRPSPTPPRIVSDLEAMTPVQSDHEEADSPMHTYGGPLHFEQSSDMDFDMDMDEDSQHVRSQPPGSPYANSLFMRPPMLNASLFGSDTVNSNGRIPTPIHPTFKRSGVMNGLGFPTSGSAGGLSTNDMIMTMPSMQAPTSRKGNRQEMDEDRSRRMPSPISEDEDYPDTPTALTQSQLSRLSFAHANPTDQMETETTLAPPPTPRGRKRSGALTGMGRFSMGYRDECEKCRQRVPGHYSHFLS